MNVFSVTSIILSNKGSHSQYSLLPYPAGRKFQGLRLLTSLMQDHPNSDFTISILLSTNNVSFGVDDIVFVVLVLVKKNDIAKLSPNFSLAGLGLVLTPIPPAPTHPPIHQTRLVVKWPVVHANQIILGI